MTFCGSSTLWVTGNGGWGQLSPRSQPLCRSSFSQHSPSLSSRLSKLPHPSQFSLRGTAELSCPPTSSIAAPALCRLGSRLAISPCFLLLRLCAYVCVCVCAGDTLCKNSWITETRQDFWTALEQMVDELDQGIKTPEIENASVADGWDCGIVSWGLGAWALLCSIFFFFFSPPLCHRQKFLSLTSYIHTSLSPLQAPAHLWPTPCARGKKAFTP